MSKPLHAIGNAAALADSGSAKLHPAAPHASHPLGRPDSLTAQRIEVGLILHAMLGESAASDYLARQSVSAKVARRVLSESGRRRRGDKGAKLA